MHAPVVAKMRTAYGSRTSGTFLESIKLLVKRLFKAFERIGIRGLDRMRRRWTFRISILPFVSVIEGGRISAFGSSRVRRPSWIE